MATKYHICGYAFCARSVPKGTKRCDEHAKIKDVSGWIRSPSRRNREKQSNGRPWRRLRARVLQRDMHCCVMCKAEGLIKAADEVDHINPTGGEDMSNLQSLCHAHHARKTQQEAQQARGSV